MSRSTFGFTRSFNTGRKISRDNRKHVPNNQQRSTGSEHNELHEKRQRSRHDNSDADKATRSIFGDVPLTDTERRYLWAAQSGNLPALDLLLQEAGTFNLSCRDYLGRTALQLAVLGEHYDCIEVLLEKSRLDVIEEGLLHAINTENVKICDMFLSHPVYSDQRSRMQMEFQHGFYEQEDSSSSFAPDITPIVLAAQCNNFDIVHMLIQKGFTISTPHNYFCLCTECYNHKNFDRVVHSKSRLNAYRGLASTAYLCLSCDDPIYAAFELSRNLQKLADREKEHKNEYKKLSDKCKNFAVDLLDHSRTNEEVMAALHGCTDTRDLSRIKMAIRYEQKKVVYISRELPGTSGEHVVLGASWFQHQNFGVKLIMVPFGVIFIPVTAIIYVFLPYSRIGKILKSPFMKFMNYICSYTAFLVLLFLGTQLSSFKSSHLFVGTEGAVNGLIMFYVLGMFWAECKQLWEEGVRGYFSQMWNYMDITMLALYTAGYTTEAVIYTKTQGYANHILHSQNEPILNPQIVSKVLFSVANVMSFARIAYILPANETFGQLQISYGRMLQDVGKFIFIYFTVMIAFICGLTSLYSISRNDHFEGLLETTGTLFWAAFGMGNSKAPEILNDDFHESSLDDEGKKIPDDALITDKEHLAVIEIVGYILYGVYILGAVVVLINMLIAMMSNTFEDIQKSEDCEWKFARAKLWISFIEQGTTLPIPFNIIPTPKSALKIFRWFNECICCGQNKQNFDWHNYNQYDQKYKAIMHRVVLRYIHKMKFEKKGESLKEEVLDTREEVIFQLHSVYGRLAARIELLEKDMFALSKSVMLWQDETQAHSSLSYSRSVPAHPRKGDNFRHSLSDNPRESYLQRRRSCYFEKCKPEVPEQAGMSIVNIDNSRPAFCSSNQNDHNIKQVSNNFQTMGAATNNGSNTCDKDDDNETEMERKISEISLSSHSHSNPDDDYLTAKRASNRLRSTSSCGSDHRVRGDVRTGLCSRDENLRDNRARDGYSSNCRRPQSVIKESSLEDHMSTSSDKPTSFSARGQTVSRHTGSVKMRRETCDNPDDDAPSAILCGDSRNCTTNYAGYGELDDVSDQINQDNKMCLQQKFNSRINSRHHQPTLTGDQTEQANTLYAFSKTDLTNQRFSASQTSSIHNTTDSINTSESSNVECYVSKLPSVSQESTINSGHLDSPYCPSQNSSKSFDESDRQLHGSLSPLTLTQDERLPTKQGRKLGHVNHIYMPEYPSNTAWNDYGLKHTSNNSQPVFYTNQSRAYRYSMSDLHARDQLESSPIYDSSDDNKESRYDLKDTVSNKQNEAYRQIPTSHTINFSTVPTQSVAMCADFHSENSARLTRPSATSDTNTSLIDESSFGRNALGEKQESKPDTLMTTISSETRSHDSTSIRQFADSTFYKRKSPMRKRESMPVISIANKALRFHQMRPEDRHQYPTTYSAIPDFQSFAGRYQHYNTGDLGANARPDDFTTQISMTIPAMATNLRPFPIPSNDLFQQRQPQPQQYSSDAEYSAASDSSNMGSPKPKSSRVKKTSFVSFVRGQRSSKGKKSEIKHNRSLSMTRYSSSSRNERLRTLHQQRSKEV